MCTSAHFNCCRSRGVSGIISGLYKPALLRCLDEAKVLERELELIPVLHAIEIVWPFILPATLQKTQMVPDGLPEMPRTLTDY